MSAPPPACPRCDERPVLEYVGMGCYRYTCLRCALSSPAAGSKVGAMHEWKRAIDAGASA